MFAAGCLWSFWYFLCVVETCGVVVLCECWDHFVGFLLSWVLERAVGVLRGMGNGVDVLDVVGEDGMGWDGINMGRDEMRPG